MKNKRFKSEIISAGQIVVPFFRGEKLGIFSGSLPDIAAAASGVKPACRLVLSSYEQAAAFLLFCEENDFYRHIPKTKSKTKYAFISKSPETIARLKKIPPRFFYADSLKSPERKIISAALGYPPCCAKSHLGDRGNIGEILNSAPEKINFVFNNFLGPVSNFYLSFHFPCSFSCGKTLEYNREIFSVLKGRNPDFAASLEKYLKMPVLVFGSPTSFNDFWNSRVAFVFDGNFSAKNEVVYKNVFKVVPFEDNFFPKKFAPDFNRLFAAFKKSDKVKAENDSLESRKGKKIIARKADFGPEIVFKLFNFGG